MHRITRVFGVIAPWLRKHQRVLVGGFCVLAIVTCAVLVPSLSFATLDETDVVARNATALDLIVNWIADIFNGIARFLGKFVLTLIAAILIPILNYDGFATSAIVGLGWALVRDTVNMFVVVVLLVIAVLTIVGSPKVNWQQQIPRLFIYVVMVNFSRTICGFLIDIGNVIMFQFVNALVEIGAGNFAQLLKLNIAGDYSSDLTGNLISETHSMQNLGAAFLQVALMTMIVVVVGIIAIVLIYRIVALWVLIIMSPAAFFLGGIKDIFAQAGSAYQQWWKKFSAAIVLGPILTFFLWLALAASAGGDIASKENFPTGSTESFGLVLKVFDMSQLTGLLLAIVLLVVGLQQAASSAGALGGIAAKLVSEDMGFKIAKAGLKWPSTAFRGTSAGAGYAYKAANYVAPETTARVSAELTKSFGSGVSKVGTLVSDTPGFSMLGAPYLGRKLSEQGNKMYNAGEHINEEQKKKARESLKHVPDSYKEKMYRDMADGKGTFTGMSKWQQEVMYEDLATKLGATKAAAAALGDTPSGREKHDKLMRTVIKRTHKKLEDGHSDLDEDGRKNFDAIKSTYLDLTFEALNEVEATKFVQSEKFQPRIVRNRALNGENITDAQTLGRPRRAGNNRDNLLGVRKMLEDKVVGVDKNGRNITAMQNTMTAQYGQPLKQAEIDGRRVLRYRPGGPGPGGPAGGPSGGGPGGGGAGGGTGAGGPGTGGGGGAGGPGPGGTGGPGTGGSGGSGPGGGGPGGGGAGGGPGGPGGGSGGSGGGPGGGGGSGGAGGGPGGGSGGAGGRGGSRGGRSGSSGSSPRVSRRVYKNGGGSGSTSSAGGGPSAGAGSPASSGASGPTPVEVEEEPETVTVRQLSGRPAVVAKPADNTVDAEFDVIEEAPKTVRPFADADAALEAQAANNNDNFDREDEKSTGRGSGFSGVA